MKKRKRVLAVVLALVLVLLLIPIKTFYNDGGTVKYSAVLWQVEDLHKIVSLDNGEMGWLVGPRVTLLCGLITVYDGSRMVADA